MSRRTSVDVVRMRAAVIICEDMLSKMLNADEELGGDL